MILRSKATGQEIVLSTTHLKAKLEALRSSFRTEQSKDLLAWLESVRGGRPVILTGDLNGLPSEQFYSVLTGSPDLPLVSSYRVREEDGGDYICTSLSQGDQPGGSQTSSITVLSHTAAVP